MALRKTADLFSCRGWEGDSTGGQSGLASGHLSKVGRAALLCCKAVLLPQDLCTCSSFYIKCSFLRTTFLPV